MLKNAKKKRMPYAFILQDRKLGKKWCLTVQVINIMQQSVFIWRFVTSWKGALLNAVIIIIIIIITIIIIIIILILSISFE